ncbi:MAG: serine/threonine-protein kinase [Gemmatimonadales bacterium]
MKTAWVGRTLPSGLRVRASLGSTPDGDLFSATYPTGLEVALLIPRHRRDCPGESVVLDGIRERTRAAMEIKHPNVAEVYASGETDDGWLYVVLELLAGEPVSVRLAEREAIPVTEAVEIVRQACAGMQAAHAHGIVHGNLSPQCLLLLSAAYGPPRVKVSGFSLTAPPRGGALTDQEKATEGARFASPERLAGQAPDTRSDIFSLGAILHELLSGTPPSAGPLADAVPRSLRPVLGRALATGPPDRYQSMSEFAAALDGAAETLDRVTRFQGKRRRIIQTAAAVLAVATGFGVVHRSYGGADSMRPQAPFPETGRAVVGERDRMTELRESPRGPQPPRRPGTPRQAPNGSKPPRGGPLSPSPLTVDTNVSPFRRSHPWAAVPGGRYYYRSSCPAVLRLPELVFFATEAEARAQGFDASDIPGCH